VKSEPTVTRSTLSHTMKTNFRFDPPLEIKAWTSDGELVSEEVVNVVESSVVDLQADCSVPTARFFQVFVTDKKGVVGPVGSPKDLSWHRVHPNDQDFIRHEIQNANEVATG